MTYLQDEKETLRETGENEEFLPVEQLRSPSHQDGSAEHFLAYISWENLCFQVDVPAKGDTRGWWERTRNPLLEKKVILHELNGHVKPGELCAVIGPSGSGKTSFLNIIAGRLSEGVSGSVQWNGADRPANFNRHTGYVVQEDLYFEALTVRETLEFAVSLKLPMSLSKAEKAQRVDTWIDELDLRGCENTRVGKIGQGISGGERRRLAMAVELIDDPPVLLLDEPTSGLDSASALKVGSILRRLAHERRVTIITTIHQPRISLARMFDKIYFLAKGKELYFGPAFPDVVTFFSDAGFPMPEFENPMDVLLDLVNTQDTAGEGDVTQNREEIIERVHESYKNSTYASEYALGFTVPAYFSTSDLFTSKMDEDSGFITPAWNQMWVLLRRALLTNLREDIALATQSFNSVFMPLIFGAIYFRMDLSVQGAYDRLSAISLQILFGAFFSMDILLLLPKERPLFLREHASGMYSSAAFFFGRAAAELPTQTILSLCNAVVAYFMFGLQDDVTKFLYFWISLFLCIQTGSSCFLAIGAASPNFDMSNLLVGVILLCFMLFDGNWISLDKIPPGWRWIKELSFMGLAGNSAIANEYRGLVFACLQSDVNAGACWHQPITKNITVNGTIHAVNTTMLLPADLTGEKILGQRGLGNVNVTENFWVLCLHVCVWRLIGLFFWTFFYRYESPTYLMKRAFCSCLEKK